MHWRVVQGAEDDGAGTTKRDALGGDLMCTLMAALHFPVSLGHYLTEHLQLSKIQRQALHVRCNLSSSSHSVLPMDRVPGRAAAAAL